MRKKFRNTWREDDMSIRTSGRECALDQDIFDCGVEGTAEPSQPHDRSKHPKVLDQSAEAIVGLTRSLHRVPLRHPPRLPGPEPSGEHRTAQFWRANFQPSERYVLSLPGTVQYRLAADGSGYDNLILAGDWTKTDWNVGCIEAAVTSGINAAAAVEGEPGSQAS